MTVSRNLWKTLSSALVALCLASLPVAAQTYTTGPDAMSNAQLVRGAPVNNQSVVINTAAASTVQLVPLVAGQRIAVAAVSLIAAGATNITFEYGTGTNCGTGTTALTGPYPMVTSAQLQYDVGLSPLWYLPAGTALCMVNSAAIQVSGFITYEQF